MMMGNWGRQSNLQNAVSACERFGLSGDEAKALIAEMTAIVRDNWKQVFSDSGVPEGDLHYLAQATLMNESVFYDLT
ncbi:hypothetical protein ACFOZ5_02500 [Marinobacter lacisalsi]|uniref:HipA-like C-terminal domain-containing protein n=1 Tax=Marinobacter lacisalsi TaxID=475979 RepID=A0ABV8QEE4_9GAMM